MAIGLGVLGLSPLVFWALTPRELDAALTGKLGRASAQRDFAGSDLDALMHRYPDKELP